MVAAIASARIWTLSGRRFLRPRALKLLRAQRAPSAGYTGTSQSCRRVKRLSALLLLTKGVTKDLSKHERPKPKLYPQSLVSVEIFSI